MNGSENKNEAKATEKKSLPARLVVAIKNKFIKKVEKNRFNKILH